MPLRASISRPRVSRAWALAAIGAAAFVGCNQLLGNDAGDQLTSSSGGGGHDAGAEGGPDGGADAALDAPPACAMIAPEDGGCASPRTLCGATCFNLSCDPGNCGACNHDCAGGACGAGQCGPTTLRSGEGSPLGLAVDDAGIYWTDHTGGEVRMMALDGGGVASIASGQAGPLGIAVTPTHVYWGNTGDNTLQGTSKTMFGAMFFASASKPSFLAASPTVLFWANAGNGTLEGASLADGGIERDSDAGGASPSDVALNDTAVFWTTTNGVYSAPLSGGNGTVAAKDAAGAIALAVTATTIYWTNNSGTVHAQAIGSGTQSQIHSGEAKPTGMAVDDANVYWVDEGTGNVYRAPLDATNDTKTEIIATGQAGPYRIAVDAKFVYWTNYTGGTVARLAK